MKIICGPQPLKNYFNQVGRKYMNFISNIKILNEVNKKYVRTISIIKILKWECFRLSIIFVLKF